MIRRSLALALLTISAPLAFASGPTPSGVLLRVEQASGYIDPEWSYSQVCLIQTDKVRRQFYKGGDGVVHDEESAVAFTAKVKSLADVGKLLKRAAAGRMKFTEGPTDVPTSSYTGVIEGDVVTKLVNLYIVVDEAEYRNTSRATDALVEFADKNCPLPSFESK